MSLKTYEEKLKLAFPGAKLSLQDHGGGDHLHLEIEAKEFIGKSKVQQHQMIYKVLHEEMKGPIHALSINSKALN